MFFGKTLLSIIVLGICLSLVRGQAAGLGESSPLPLGEETWFAVVPSAQSDAFGRSRHHASLVLVSDRLRFKGLGLLPQFDLRFDKAMSFGDLPVLRALAHLLWASADSLVALAVDPRHLTNGVDYWTSGAGRWLAAGDVQLRFRSRRQAGRTEWMTLQYAYAIVWDFVHSGANRDLVAGQGRPGKLGPFAPFFTDEPAFDYLMAFVAPSHGDLILNEVERARLAVAQAGTNLARHNSGATCRILVASGAAASP